MKSSVRGGTKMKGGTKPAADCPPLVSGNPKVAKEAESAGGHFKGGGRVGGKKAAMRLDRPGRKRGGRVGADGAPLSAAASTSARSEGTGPN